MFTLRRASEADFPAIKRLIHQTGINPMGLDWSHFLLAVDETGAMIGCGQIKPHNDGTLELASIAVVPEMRGKGVALSIIEKLLAENTGTLYLTCRPALGPLYEKFGFRRLDQKGPLPPYFRRLSRIVVLLKRLHAIPADGLLIMRRD